MLLTMSRSYSASILILFLKWQNYSKQLTNIRCSLVEKVDWRVKKKRKNIYIDSSSFHNHKLFDEFKQIAMAISCINEADNVIKEEIVFKMRVRISKSSSTYFTTPPQKIYIDAYFFHKPLTAPHFWKEKSFFFRYIYTANNLCSFFYWSTILSLNTTMLPSSTFNNPTGTGGVLNSWRPATKNSFFF